MYVYISGPVLYTTLYPTQMSLQGIDHQYLDAWRTHVQQCLNNPYRINKEGYMKRVCSKYRELERRFPRKPTGRQQPYTINVWPDPSKSADASSPEQVAQYLFALKQEVGFELIDCKEYN